MPESTRSRRWLGIISERHSKGGFCHNSVLVTDTEREMRQLVAEAAGEKETKEIMMDGNMWIVTCQFDMDSELPAPEWAAGDEEEYYYDEYDRLNDMGEWVGNFYEWLGDWEDGDIIDLLEQWLSYMTIEGASYGVNIHNMSSQPLLEWYVAGWGGRYVKKAG